MLSQYLLNEWMDGWMNKLNFADLFHVHSPYYQQDILGNKMILLIPTSVFYSSFPSPSFSLD